MARGKPPFELEFTFRNYDKLISIAHELTNFGRWANESLMDDLGDAMVSIIQDRIRWGKDSPRGSLWPPNKDGTSTLFRTGRHLWDSIKKDVGLFNVRVGTTWEYAGIHQYGATIRSSRPMSFKSGGKWWKTTQVTIPARPFMGMSPDDADKLEKIVKSKVEEFIPFRA